MWALRAGASSAKARLHNGDSPDGKINRAVIEREMEELREYPEFAAIEDEKGTFNLTVDYSAESSAYDPETHTIIINPGDFNAEYAAEMPPGYEQTLSDLPDAEYWQAIDSYPKWHKFSVKRVLFHEANHALQPVSGLKYSLNPGKYERPVIQKTNEFMYKNFGEPYRKDHTTVRY